MGGGGESAEEVGWGFWRSAEKVRGRRDGVERRGK